MDTVTSTRPRDAESTFLNKDYQLQEASLFAGRLFKRVLYYMCSAPRTFLSVVTRRFNGFEDESRQDIEWLEKAAKILVSKGECNTSRAFLTFLTHYSHTRANQALEMGNAMVDTLDGYIKLFGQWRNPTSNEINVSPDGESFHCLVGIDPEEPPNMQNGH